MIAKNRKRMPLMHVMFEDPGTMGCNTAFCSFPSETKQWPSFSRDAHFLQQTRNERENAGNVSDQSRPPRAQRLPEILRSLP